MLPLGNQTQCCWYLDDTSPSSPQGGFLVRVSPHTGSLVISVKNYSEEAGQYRFTKLDIIKNYMREEQNIEEELNMFHSLLQNFHAHMFNQVPTQNIEEELNMFSLPPSKLQNADTFNQVPTLPCCTKH